MTDTFHSFHAFLFPFEWKQRSSQGLLDDQTRLGDIRSIMATATADWEQLEPWSKPSSLVQFNESNYFFGFVRPVLYGDGEGTFQIHYQNRQARGSQYVIRLHDGSTFRLELDDIGISFYNTGVGILSFHAYNREHPDPGDILKINQFGRRLYPPFLGTDAAKTGTQAFFDDADWGAGLARVQQLELAQSIILEKNGTAWAVEDFSQWRQTPVLNALPGLVSGLLPRCLANEFQLAPVLDDRMFVVCWVGNDDLAGKIRDFKIATDERDWWYKFIFVDGNLKSCQNEKLTQRQLKAHSNLRWANFSTLYGVSRYSFVCLTSSLPTLLANNAAFLVSHIQTIYFKLAELALVQRACVLRFSDEVTEIGKLESGDRTLAARAGSLARLYIRFINKIYFREVTTQEQGIELYDLLQTHMRIKPQVEDLDREIHELHQYVALQEEDQRNEKLDVLTYIGAFFVVPSFLMSYLGMSAFQAGSKPTFGDILLCLFSSLCIGTIMLIGLRRKGFLRWTLLVAALIAATLFMVCIPNWIFN